MKPISSVLFFLLISITTIFGNVSVKPRAGNAGILNAAVQKQQAVNASCIKQYISPDHISEENTDDLSFFGDDEQEETTQHINSARYFIIFPYLSFLKDENSFTKNVTGFYKPKSRSGSAIYIRHCVLLI